MSFLAPAFLAALGALAIPVIVHLVNRERREVVAFPSLMFLRKVSYRAVRRQKLRHLLLLAMRCLSLAIIAAAFARPFFTRRSAALAAVGGGREIVVLLDRSYSMGYGDRWRRATDAARQAVAGLGAADRATLVGFDATPRVLTPPTSDARRLAAALSAARPADGDTRYAPALQLAARILGGSNLPRREVVLISDFQRRGWNRPEAVSLPKGARLSTVDVSSPVSADAAVASVAVARDSSGGRPVITVSARLTNTGGSAAARQAALELNGRVMQTKAVSIPAAGALQVTFAALPVPATTSRGVVRLTPDALAADDRYQFTISPDAALSVLLVEPAQPRQDQSLFATRALSLATRPAMRVDGVRADALRPADLAGRSLVILDEVAPPAAALRARLRDFVAAGGGLVIVPGDTRADWSAFLPVSVGTVVDRAADGGATLASIDYGSPVFELFAAPHAGDFTAARFLRYRALRVSGDTGVIARFDNGDPALVVRGLGAGRVAMWASSLDTWWNDLPLQPVWVPFLHQLAKGVGRFTDSRNAYTIGEVLDLTRHSELVPASAGPAASRPSMDVVSPDGNHTRLAPGDQRPAISLDEQGFYEIRAVGGPASPGAPVAVNVDPAEADLSHMPPAELVAAVGADTSSRAAAGEEQTLEQRERSQTLWWYLLLGAMVLLAAETVLANRLSRSPAA